MRNSSLGDNGSNVRLLPGALQGKSPNFGINIVETQDKRERRRFRWSKTARECVRANIHAKGAEFSSMITRLVEETGNPRWACRRFVRSMGVRSKRVQKSWTTAEQQRLLKLLDLHPINEIARLMRRSRSSVWHMLYRLGANAEMGKDSFTKYSLASLLHVRPDTIEQWIKRGWLKARQLESGRTLIEAADFCQFCKLHTRDVIGNRLNKERLEFVYHFAFPPSHSELLPVRQSKKERAAYEEQVREEQQDECARKDDDLDSRNPVDLEDSETRFPS